MAKNLTDRQTADIRIVIYDTYKSMKESNLEKSNSKKSSRIYN